MKKFAAHSFIFVKIITLFCISNMGLFSMDNVVEAKIPCHQEVSDKSEDKNCSACVESVNIWLQKYVKETQNYEIVVIDTILPDFFAIEERINSIKYEHFSYIPPPQVVYINAFNLEHNSVVIIT